MSYCSNCGTPLRDGARFCPNCGQQVNTAQGQPNESFWDAAAEPGEVVLSSWENPNPQPTPQPQTQPQQTAGARQQKTSNATSRPVQEQPQRKSHGCLWAILIVLALVAGFFVYAFYIM